MPKRDTPDEETGNWRAVCGKTARTVRRAGRATFPTPITAPRKPVAIDSLMSPQALTRRGDRDAERRP